ncbi:MarR family winged helix-turn-helix transcriptional regulator [Micromonospora sagamiensis]|uniref:Transcriptional regulator, MarR family with acetyltransferase activity n=1 Tax=Micromonospora sagamiensis TaxID=47875 RepID=A0A562WG50_9ACTN|nr:MarR family winged helix-turn-helix transcriptional regulator [Micromonospora sagamiensis]TWJ28887.1 transcriptional regulator, MarR family with acetyltransferase activity [Micromonospora sagamiensis]BCL18086.1 PadR family transcriptional regulator [Micromonospora sagamiensis]
METDLIERVRDFNRFYTERLGLLTDHYLGLDRPLGPSRLLWEIGDRAAVRELRDRLGLDTGYLSRLLRSLEEQGLVRVVPHPADGRARIAELTDAGRRERGVLDDRSRAGAAALLGELSPGQQEELVAAQQQIRRLLRLATVTITPVAADDPQAWWCLRRYAAELAERFPEGYDEATLTPPEDLDGSLLLAREHGRPAGCGAWVRLAPGVGEIRHLWTDATCRGLGLGRRLLERLEADAVAHGVGTVRLGTHRSLGEAIALYRGSGYQEVASYSPSPYNQLCFEKRL